MKTVLLFAFPIFMVLAGCGRNMSRASGDEKENLEQGGERELLDSVRGCILTNGQDAARLGDLHQSALMEIDDRILQRQRAQRFEDFVFSVRIDTLPYDERGHALVAIETLSSKTWLPAYMAQEWNRRLRMIEFMRKQKLSASAGKVQSECDDHGYTGGEGNSGSGFIGYIDSYVRAHLEFYELEFAQRASGEMETVDFQHLSQRFEQVLGRKLRTADQIKEDRSHAKRK